MNLSLTKHEFIRYVRTSPRLRCLSHTEVQRPGNPNCERGNFLENPCVLCEMEREHFFCVSNQQKEVIEWKNISWCLVPDCSTGEPLYCRLRAPCVPLHSTCLAPQLPSSQCVVYKGDEDWTCDTNGGDPHSFVDLIIATITSSWGAMWDVICDYGYYPCGI